MLLTEARRTARVSVTGELVTLDEQDRGAWDASMVGEGHRLVRERLATGVAPGRYQILAAINAVHTSAADMRDTDWSQIVALYDQLIGLDPSPIVALNRAIAVGELDGPVVALAAVDRLEESLGGYHAYHATRAELLRRLDRGAGGPRRVRQRHRAGGQHRRDGLSDPPPGRAVEWPPRDPRDAASGPTDGPSSERQSDQERSITKEQSTMKLDRIDDGLGGRRLPGSGRSR